MSTAKRVPAQLPGLRLDLVTRWLADRISLEPPLTAKLIAGGRSNLTFRLVDAEGRRWALRRPPAGVLLSTAHDMGREWTVLNAVAQTSAPAPTPVALCEDDEVTGAPFYVMDWVDGIVPADRATAETLPPQARATLTENLADVLAALHALDPEQLGLAQWVRPGDYLQRQLSRWHRQLQQSGSDYPALADELHDTLVRRAPTGTENTLVHGDFRAGNVMVGPDGRIVAVLDWELSTLGHPLADLGWLLASWASAGDELPSVTETPSVLPGFGTREELARRYEHRSGRNVNDLTLYEAFARWRSACITSGVRARYVAGIMGTDDFDAARMAERVREQLQAAALLLAET